MNQDRENELPGAESDSLVSAEYRATATERTPPALDSMVLEKARAAASDTGLRGFTAFWFRPLAFVATVALSLALLLELTSPPDLQSVRSPEPGRFEAESTFADPLRQGPDVSSDVRPNAESPPAKNQAIDPNLETGRRQPAEPAASRASADAPAADERTSSDFAEMIEASSKQMQKPDAVSEIANQGLRESRADDSVGEAAAFRASAILLDEAARPCTEKQITLPETWWQCISDLEEAGRLQEAKNELDRFNRAHPDFIAPEILPSQ